MQKVKSLDKHRIATEGHLRPGPPARTGRTPVQVWTHPEAALAHASRQDRYATPKCGMSQDVSILAEQNKTVSTLQQP
jgi:hypothetical protein